MAYSEKLADRIRAVLPTSPPIDEKKMFGGLAFMAGGKMFCGILGEDLMARVGPDGYEDALERPHVRPMDFTGRPLRGYVYVAPAGCADARSLRRWVAGCLEFVGTLEKPARKKR
jgi:TfoX/Sxy family transcriptional regulator of competence genes